MSSAANKVFALPELVEQILLSYTDVSAATAKHLANIRRVNSTCNDTIARCDRLQQALFLSPAPITSALFWNNVDDASDQFLRIPVIREGRERLGVSVEKVIATINPRIPYIHATSPHPQTVIFIKIEIQSPSLKTGDFDINKRSFFTQPPCTVAQLTLTHGGSPIRVEDSQGITLGLMEEKLIEASSRVYSEWRKLHEKRSCLLRCWVEGFVASDAEWVIEARLPEAQKVAKAAVRHQRARADPLGFGRHPPPWR